MSLCERVDGYCERTDASLWSEPVNALTNLGFLLAAWLLWRERERLWAHGRRPAASIAALPLLLALIGLCSLLFHTLATRRSGLADQFSIFGVCAMRWSYWSLSRGLMREALRAASDRRPKEAG